MQAVSGTRLATIQAVLRHRIEMLGLPVEAALKEPAVNVSSIAHLRCAVANGWKRCGRDASKRRGCGGRWAVIKGSLRWVIMKAAEARQMNLVLRATGVKTLFPQPAVAVSRRRAGDELVFERVSRFCNAERFAFSGRDGVYA